MVTGWLLWQWIGGHLPGYGGGRGLGGRAVVWFIGALRLGYLWLYGSTREWLRLLVAARLVPFVGLGLSVHLPNYDVLKSYNHVPFFIYRTVSVVIYKPVSVVIYHVESPRCLGTMRVHSFMCWTIYLMQNILLALKRYSNPHKNVTCTQDDHSSLVTEPWASELPACQNLVRLLLHPWWDNRPILIFIQSLPNLYLIVT